MVHKMKLEDQPFKMIKSGQKTFELRLYDQKRQVVRVGDIITFTNRKTNEKMDTKVLDINVYDNFKELYKNYDKKELGYLDNEDASYKDMLKYYSEEEQEKYKAVAIRIEKLK